MEAQSPIKRLPDITIRTRTHLAHGLRSNLYPDGTFRIEPVGDKQGIQIAGVNPARFAELIVRMQLLIVGIESLDAATGQRIEWLAAASDEANARLGARPDRIWSEIRNRAAKVGDERAIHLCSAISFHYLAAEISLRRVSEGYHALQRHVHRTKTPIGHRFTNMDTFDLYNDLHGFFVNLGSTRDYLASFIAEKIDSDNPVSGHSSLLKRIRHSDAEVHRVVQTFSDREFSPIGLAHIGEYRDILVHRSPIGSLTEDWVEVVGLREPLPQGAGGVSLKLPANPFDLAGETVDALLLVHHALLIMAKYLIEIAQFSPIRPYRPHLRVIGGQIEEVPE
ncbi:hypothetical protein [Tsuneonella rigui]|uniref:hypothetical protein n=1 Tax=Tsuneonella rigui TaxID=1708790 RepID=UPI000F7EB5F2|nr:hypothetical protein [Tsuneonella rigui]